ncbi:cysteine desulfurase family protein [Dietzia sp. PP-33]|jgi:cysteine desulfurase|uniref:cysteine desulfurase family protein n=1 Tax=Dietzia sp. PP-33 TaxID=2957500 RepID=UPI0029B7391B|nr:aminotransferase class V-fold PLP-dependent enzyme [Dietzia sp. PP-33]MDX2355705.1 aminotransferase class V-fold PLP-dependent enzyme [Dietzia sp. PP-33]
MLTTRTAHYLDHAATTPMRPAAIAAYAEAAATVGNASSLHGAGRRARRRLEEARESLAAHLGCRPSEVVFTSGGTESDNLAVLGQAAAAAGDVVAVGATEHHSVLDSAAHLATDRGGGMDVRVLPVDRHGAVTPGSVHDLVAEVGPRLALVAAMVGNNEIGTLTDVAAVSAAASAAGAAVHTDAVQAVGHVPVDFGALGVTSLSLSAHKFGGPLGVGALLIDRGADCLPVGFGGGQERDLRSGSVDVPGVVAMAVALDEAVREMASEARRLERLRDRLVAGILAEVPDAIANGGGDRLPGIANLTFPGCSGESLILLLDAAGVECSTGSACTAGVAEPSHVLLALGAGEAAARSSLRLSLGYTTTEDDVAAAVAALGPAAERARVAGLGLMRTEATAS